MTCGSVFTQEPRAELDGLGMRCHTGVRETGCIAALWQRRHSDRAEERYATDL